VSHAAIGPIAVHLPSRVETNAELKAQFPEWDMDSIGEKTGIHARHIAAPDECSSDLAVAAAEKLFAEHGIAPESVDYLLFCTQTPDYSLPTTACLLQQRLGLRTSIGALDFNLGCSGFVYGLSLADGLIRAGMAERVLLITAETYTKLIHPTDRSLRTIFGDAGAATLIQAHSSPSLSAFRFGTDGSGADTLLATRGGFRDSDQMIKPRHRKRWPSELYMDGPSLINFSVGKIPDLVAGVCELSGRSMSEFDWFLMHQATFKMLDQMRLLLEIPVEKLPIRLEHFGNTVSCTIPILIEELRRTGELQPHHYNMLVGFGVGWSWAGCLWQDVLGPFTST
jgi:3-oxoacyl-[acyl-carrier-protein] synthase III